jgi:hypothetical protein
LFGWFSFASESLIAISNTPPLPSTPISYSPPIFLGNFAGSLLFLWSSAFNYTSRRWWWCFIQQALGLGFVCINYDLELSSCPQLFGHAAMRFLAIVLHSTALALYMLLCSLQLYHISASILLLVFVTHVICLFVLLLLLSLLLIWWFLLLFASSFGSSKFLTVWLESTILLGVRC